MMDLGEIQFFWRVNKEKNAKNIAPDFLPFILSFDSARQLFIQLPNISTFQHLEAVYRSGENVGYLQKGHPIGEQYALDFLSFIKKNMPNHTPEKKTRVTEIGCGDGYLLDELEKAGNSVLGIEPNTLKANSKIIQGFYPKVRPDHKSDIIIHYDVLEHISKPSDFLSEHLTDLEKDGKVIFAVPNCGNYLSIGDISPMIHEHFNYFDEESLMLTVKSAGFQKIQIENSSHGALLFCAAQKGDTTESSHMDINSSQFNYKKFDKFTAESKLLQKNLLNFIYDIEAQQKSLGFYVPLRALPYLSACKSLREYRFFDDNPDWHGKYFDGFSQPIENIDDLQNKPVDHIIIMSIGFANAIESKLSKILFEKPIHIHTLQDFSLPVIP